METFIFLPFPPVSLPAFLCPSQYIYYSRTSHSHTLSLSPLPQPHFFMRREKVWVMIFKKESAMEYICSHLFVQHPSDFTIGVVSLFHSFLFPFSYVVFLVLPFIRYHVYRFYIFINYAFFLFFPPLSISFFCLYSDLQ